jgi:hypothetical protein
MTNQEELINKIKLLSDSIRKKNLSLKVGLLERNKFLEDTFKPIVDPLNQINDKITKSDRLNEEVIGEKKKQEIKEYDTDTSTFETESLSRTSEVLEGDEEEEEKTDMDETKGSNLDETAFTESPTNISILSQEIVKKGPLSRKYILNMLHSGAKSNRYHVYGARLEKDGLRIGDSTLKVDDNDSITIKNQTFKGTSGLFELIFKNSPTKYTKYDLNSFKTICALTNLHRKGYSQNTPIHRNRSEKYKNIISKLFNNQRGKRSKAKGKGLAMKSVYDTNVIYYNDVNKLVDRMKLLYESIEAGHTGLDNEMVALTEELKSRGYIS